MSPLDWFYILTAWFAIACALAVLFGRSIRIADKHEQPDDHVVPLYWLPPVRPTRLPKVSPRDLEWYSLDASFYAVIAGEFE